MNPFKYLLNYFLNKSKSYNFYKNNYNQIIKKNERDTIKIKELTKQLNELSLTNKDYNDEINHLKKSNENYKKQIETIDTLLEINNNNLNEIKRLNNLLLNKMTELKNNSLELYQNIQNINYSYDNRLNKATDNIISEISSSYKKTRTFITNNNKMTINEIKKENMKNKENLALLEDNITNNNDYLLEYLNQNLNLDKIDIFNNISNELHENNFTNLNAYKEINKTKLFDESYYQEKYNYNSDIDPLLHYIYKGYKENKNPSSIFDNEFYKNSNESITKSKLNPLVYFVTRGLKEGNVKVNPEITNVNHINKFELDEKISDFKKDGIEKRKRKPKLIVSLTSYPERMYDIHYCLYSLLNQDLKPDKVILWLAKEEFPEGELDIPKEVLKLKNNGLTIKFCENIKSYKKSIPTLKEYPDDILVTADDDIYYPKDWLKNLYEEHKKHPKCVIGLRSRRMQLNNDDKFIDYNQWKIANEEKEASYLNFMTGSGGILYPPNCFYKDVLKKDIFLDISEIGDDLWLWAMAVLNKTKYKVPSKRYNSLIYINPARERLLIKESTLWELNMIENQNNKQLKSIIKRYPEIIDIIKEENK